VGVGGGGGVAQGGNEGGTQREEVTDLTVVLEPPTWLEGCHVGCLKMAPCTQSLKESFVLGGFSHFSLRYLGESYVLLSCAEDEGMSKILTENKVWFDDLFLTVVPWDESFAVKERLVWLRCRGIPLQMWCNQCFFRVGELVGKVVEIDEATKKKEKLEYARIRVKILFNSEVKVAKVLNINGVLCTVSFEEEASFLDFVHKMVRCIWDGGGSEVDIEASSEEGSVGASIGVSMESEFEAAGGGDVGGEGGGGMEGYGGGVEGNEGAVQSRRDSSNLGMLRKQGEGVFSQGALSGALMENEFPGSKVGSVSLPLLDEACIPIKSKATLEWGGRIIDEGSSCIGERGLRSEEEELIGGSFEKGGMGSNVEGRPSRSLVGRGSLRVREGVNVVGAVFCNVSGKEVGRESYVEAGPQQELNKEVGGKELEGCKDADTEALEEGVLLEHLGSKSWVGDSRRHGISLEVSELARVRVVEEGEDEIPFLNRNGESHDLVTKGPIDGNKLEVVEDSRRFETLLGDKVGKQLTVDQVFLVHQSGSKLNSMFASDSAIENCNRIFWVKTDKNVASNVWGVGKEACFSFQGREEIVLNSICSLSNQGGVTTRKMWKERRKTVNEDN